MQEGEEAGETVARLAQSLAELGGMMDSLRARAAQLQGDLDIPALLAESIADVTRAMDQARVAMATTGDPEKMLQAVKDLNTLIEQRYTMEIDAVRTLLGMLQQSAGSLAGGFTALAQSAPTLRALGIEVGGMTDALGDVIDFLGEVGDAAGQLAVVGSQVSAFTAEISGADPSAILGSARALAGGLTATAATVNALEDAQARMAGLNQLLGALTQGYQQATAALSAHFEELRAQEEALFQERTTALQREVDDAIAIVRAYYDFQRRGLDELIASSREFAAAARRVRDQILGIQLAPTTTALNPADQLNVALAELGAVFSQFQATPTADLADRVGERVGQAMTAATEVFSRPSPAFAKFSGDMISILEAVAATAEARVTPEEEIQRLLTGIDKSETLALIKLGDINTATEAITTYLENNLTAENLDHLKSLGVLTQAQVDLATGLGKPIALSQASIDGVVAGGAAAKTAIDTLNTDHAKKLDDLKTAEEDSLTALKLEFAKVAQEIVGTTSAVVTSSGKVEGAVWANVVASGGIWQTASYLWGEMIGTRADLVRIIGTDTVGGHLASLQTQLGNDLRALGDDIEGSLRTLVETNINRLIELGGPQAVIDALKGPVERTALNTLDAVQNLWVIATRTFRDDPMGVSAVRPRTSAREGMWSVPRDMPVFVHKGEMIKPAGAAAWERQGGLADASRDERPTSVTFAPGSIVISGVSDPDRAADAVIKRIERRLGLQGKRL